LASGKEISQYLKQAGITNSGQGTFEAAWTKAITEYEDTGSCHFTNAAQDLELLHEHYPYFGAVLPILSDAQNKATLTECLPSVSLSAALLGSTTLVVLAALGVILVRRRQRSQTVLVAAGGQYASTTYPISTADSIRRTGLAKPIEPALLSPPPGRSARTRSWRMKEFIKIGRYLIGNTLALIVLWLGTLGALFATVWCLAAAVNLFQQGPRTVTCTTEMIVFPGQSPSPYPSCTANGGPLTSPTHWIVIIALACAGLFMFGRGCDLLLDDGKRYFGSRWPFQLLRLFLFGVALLIAIFAMGQLGGIAAVWSSWLWMLGGVALASLAGGISYLLKLFTLW
jgi:hypothetical protein